MAAQYFTTDFHPYLIVTGGYQFDLGNPRLLQQAVTQLLGQFAQHPFIDCTV